MNSEILEQTAREKSKGREHEVEETIDPEDFGRIKGTELADYIRFEKLSPLMCYADF